MLSKRSSEGYVLIDHRNSPGITPEFIRANKLDAPAVGAGQVFESAISVCHSCGSDVILNPNRTRDRAWCRIHDSYLCDRCDIVRRGSVGCVPLQHKLLVIYNRIAKNLFTH